MHLSVAGITVRRRAVLNVIANVCPFLIDKDDLEQIPKVLSEENTDNKNAKSKTIQFGTIDHIECETEPFRFSRKCSSTISNDGQKEHKHDPNNFLLGFGNVPENVSVEILIKLL